MVEWVQNWLSRNMRKSAVPGVQRVLDLIACIPLVERSYWPSLAMAVSSLFGHTLYWPGWSSVCAVRGSDFPIPGGITSVL